MRIFGPMPNATGWLKFFRKTSHTGADTVLSKCEILSWTPVPLRLKPVGRCEIYLDLHAHSSSMAEHGDGDVSPKAPRLVSLSPARPALAREPRSLPRVAIRDHAAADARCCCDRPLSGISAAFSFGGEAGGG